MEGSGDPESLLVIKELVKELVDECADVELIDLVFKMMVNG